MPPTEIRFDDGAAYEDYMGRWSRPVGEVFLDGLAPAPGLAWLDVGCGNGAFSEILVERARPSRLLGIDPSPQQIDFARGRGLPASAVFEVGDAMALPCADRAFDAAAMALVVFFLPDPARGVAEMARAVAPGGSVSAYAWDLHGDGFPYAPIHLECRAFGIEPVWPPSPEAARLETLAALWTGAGLVDVETRTIEVERRFDDVESYLRTALSGPRLGLAVTALTAADRATLDARLRDRLGGAAVGPVVCRARANAVRGRVAG